MAEQRYQAVLAVISDGLSVSQAAEKVGVSRQTLHAWLAATRPLGRRGQTGSTMMADARCEPVRCEILLGCPLLRRLPLRG